MSITRKSYTKGIPAIKVKADSKSELDAYIGQIGDGEVAIANGELYFKDGRNATSFTQTGTLVASGTLTSAQILALNTTPVAVIAAPGAGKCVIVDEVQLFLDYGTATYAADADEDLDFTYASGSEIMQVDTGNGFLTATADAHYIAKPTIYDADAAIASNGLVITGNVNKAVNVTIITGNVITGNSPIKYKIKYRIIDVLS